MSVWIWHWARAVPSKYSDLIGKRAAWDGLAASRTIGLECGGGGFCNDPQGSTGRQSKSRSERTPHKSSPCLAGTSFFLFFFALLSELKHNHSRHIVPRRHARGHNSPLGGRGGIRTRGWPPLDIWEEEGRRGSCILSSGRCYVMGGWWETELACVHTFKDKLRLWHRNRPLVMSVPLTSSGELLLEFLLSFDIELKKTRYIYFSWRENGRHQQGWWGR